MSDIPTQDEFLSLVRRHEVTVLAVRKDDTRTHEETLAEATEAKRALLYAHDAMTERIAELEARIANIGLDLNELANDLFNGDLNCRDAGRAALEIKNGERYI